METSKLVLFFDKCRLCLNNVGVTNIFETQDLQRDILECTGVKVMVSENLPSKVCCDCLDIVIKAKKLRNVATMNDAQLRCLFDDEDTLDLPNGSQQSSISCNYQEEKKKSYGTKGSVKESKSESVGGKKPRVEIIPPHTMVNNKQKASLIVRQDLFEPTVTSSPKEVKVTQKIKVKKRDDITMKNFEYKCVTCQREYETYKKLYLHMRMHVKKYRCPLDACGKPFATKGDLEKHLRTHTGVKPYTCEICDKSFAQQVTLRTHKESVHYCFTHVP